MKSVYLKELVAAKCKTLSIPSELVMVVQNLALCSEQMYLIFPVNLCLYKTVTENTTKRTSLVSLEQHIKNKKGQTTVPHGLRVTQNLFPQFYSANEVIQTLNKAALVTPVSLDAKL